MGQHEKCPTVLIEDVPTTEDAFKVGSKGAHERVADAIAELLLSKESGGKVIGLEGKWGAGKSSVVDMIRQKCEADDFLIVQFDAWAHEGDPLRRTYLETVIHSLQKKGWVGIDVWNDVLEKVARRISTQKRKIIPKVSKLGTIFTISILFIPLGINLIAANPNGALYKDISGWWQLRLGVVGLIISLNHSRGWGNK